jgi:hypothetical protein
VALLDAAVIPTAAGGPGTAHVGLGIRVSLGHEERRIPRREVGLLGIEGVVQGVVRRHREDDRHLDLLRSDGPPDVDRELYAVAHLDPHALVSEIGVRRLVVALLV